MRIWSWLIRQEPHVSPHERWLQDVMEMDGCDRAGAEARYQRVRALARRWPVGETQMASLLLTGARRSGTTVAARLDSAERALEVTPYRARQTREERS